MAVGIQPGELVGSDVSQAERDRIPSRAALQRLRRDGVALVCLGIVVVFVLLAVLAPVITRLVGVQLDAGDPTRDLDAYNYPAFGPPDHGFTWRAPLGISPNQADDNLAAWLYGARTSLGVAAAATLLATVIGVTVGLVAGWSGGWVDRFVGFVTEVFLSVPFLLVALALAPVLVSRFGADADRLQLWQLGSLVAVLSLFGWMPLARLIRAEVRQLREQEFVVAARAVGVRPRRILSHELLPNLTGPIIVSASLSLPAFVAAEAGLAYLGLGVSGLPSWGRTIDQAVPYYSSYPLYLFTPVVSVLLLVVALNLLGDAVRDALDPRTRHGAVS
ncbi:MAG: ABC transporter permease [Actinomycetes bacterium]